MDSLPSAHVLPTRLQISGLSHEVNDQLLWMLFSTCGTVTACKVLYDKATGFHTGQGFVDMDTRDNAKKASDTYSGREVRTTAPIPPRYGWRRLIT